MTTLDPRAVVLVRYLPGAVGQAARTVHLVPHPGAVAPRAAVTALCGALLICEQIETVTPGQGMPCTMCLLLRSSTPQQLPTMPAKADDPHGDNAAAPGPLAAAIGYRAWGWPVSPRRDQVMLDLDREVVALLIPTGLATDVAPILVAWRCPAPILAHPDAPDHRVVLTGEPFDAVLPWPPGVQHATGTLPLPPTVTPRGTVTWVHLPAEPDALRLCREIDVFAAVRTASRDLPSQQS